MKGVGRKRKEVADKGNTPCLCSGKSTRLNARPGSDICGRSDWISCSNNSPLHGPLGCARGKKADAVSSAINIRAKLYAVTRYRAARSHTANAKEQSSFCNDRIREKKRKNKMWSVKEWRYLLRFARNKVSRKKKRETYRVVIVKLRILRNPSKGIKNCFYFARLKRNDDYTFTNNKIITFFFNFDKLNECDLA